MLLFYLLYTLQGAVKKAIKLCTKSKLQYLTFDFLVIFVFESSFGGIFGVSLVLSLL